MSSERPDLIEILEEDLRWIQSGLREAEVRSLTDEEKERMRALGYL